MVAVPVTAMTWASWEPLQGQFPAATVTQDSAFVNPMSQVKRKLSFYRCKWWMSCFWKKIKISRLKLFVCASVREDCWSCFCQQYSLCVGVKHKFFRHLPRSFSWKSSIEVECWVKIIRWLKGKISYRLTLVCYHNSKSYQLKKKSVIYIFFHKMSLITLLITF